MKTKSPALILLNFHDQEVLKENNERSYASQTANGGKVLHTFIFSFNVKEQGLDVLQVIN